MKKFFAAVFFVAAAAIVIYGIKYAITPVNTQKLNYITQENSINTNGFIIRDEWVMTSRSAGTVYHNAQEGERVARDSEIGELFYGDVGEDTLKSLSVVDNKLKNLRSELNATSTAELDETAVESGIYRRENSIIDAAADNDINSVSRYKREINSLRLNNSLSTADTETELLAEREQILNDTGVNHDVITAQISGVFTTYVDGYEEQLRPEDIKGYDAAYFESLSQSPKTYKIEHSIDAGGAVCKIVNNHTWYVMMDIPSDVMEGRGEGDRVTLRLNSMAAAMTSGTVYYISEEDNGRQLVVIKCPKYLENAFSYRLADVDLIFESYTGYKIPVQAIHTEEDGRKKVIGMVGNTRYDCYCNVLFTNTDGGYMIVESSENAENKLSQMERIMVGER